MIPWIQVYSNLLTHPKTYRLAELLNLKSSDVSTNTIAAGMMVGIWSWAIQNATDGNLSHCTDRVIADAAGWRRKPTVLVKALIDSGWIDELDNYRCLHDWEDYAQLLIEQLNSQKAKTKERVKRYREKNKECKGQDEKPSSNTTVTLHNEGSNAEWSVTETLCNAPTVPNLTVPNHITTVVDNAREQNDLGRVMEYYMNYITSTPSPDAIEDVKFFLADMEPDVLLKAINRAIDSGKRSHSYITGILRAWKAAGIKNLADVARRDEEHENQKQQRRPRQQGNAGASTPSDSSQPPPGELERIQRMLSELGGDA